MLCCLLFVCLCLFIHCFLNHFVIWLLLLLSYSSCFFLPYHIQLIGCSNVDAICVCVLYFVFFAISCCVENWNLFYYWLWLLSSSPFCLCGVLWFCFVCVTCMCLFVLSVVICVVFCVFWFFCWLLTQTFVFCFFLLSSVVLCFLLFACFLVYKKMYAIFCDL